jgi:hypothetical protein
MDEKKKRNIADEEMETEIWATGEEELKEDAPPDLLKKEDPKLYKKIYGDAKVNPPGSGGKKLKSKKK